MQNIKDIKQFAKTFSWFPRKNVHCPSSLRVGKRKKKKLLENKNNMGKEKVLVQK